jgi:hypothetical protein
VPNRLFPASVGADSLDGQIDFDEAIGIGSQPYSRVLEMVTTREFIRLPPAVGRVCEPQGWP